MKVEIIEISEIWSTAKKVEMPLLFDTITNILYSKNTAKEYDWQSKLDELTYRDGDDDKFSLITVTSTSLQESNSSTLTGSTGTNLEHKFACRALCRRGRTFKYRKRKTCADNGIFSAPAGVSSHHISSSIIRRNTDNSQLVFVWPQKTNKSRVLTMLAPLLRGLLIGLFFVNSIHLWPGEFLPTSLPLSIAIPLPPVKCNVIEPLWPDNNLNDAS